MSFAWFGVEYWGDCGHSDRDEFCSGRDGEFWRHSRDQCDGCEQYVDYGDDAGARGGSGQCGGERYGRQRDFDERIYLQHVDGDDRFCASGECYAAVAGGQREGDVSAGGNGGRFEPSGGGVE